MGEIISFYQGTPDHVSRAQQRQFQTEMLNIVMEHLLAADVLLGEQAALPLMGSQHSYSHMAASVFYLASRVVDKMWHGSSIYIKDIISQMLKMLRINSIKKK